MQGSLFVSDAGRSHGGFEYNAEWNATLSVTGRTGTLRFVLNLGLGDALEKHEYRVTDFEMQPATITMRIEGQSVMLVWMEEDRIWDHSYDMHYIASWGSEAPPDEIRGTIFPSHFPGLADFWYVELRLQ